MGSTKNAINTLELLKKELSAIVSISDFYRFQELTLMYVEKYFGEKSNAAQRFGFQHLHSIHLDNPGNAEKKLKNTIEWNMSFFDAAINYIKINGVYKKSKKNIISEKSTLEVLIYVVVIFSAGFAARDAVNFIASSAIRTNNKPEIITNTDTAAEHNKNDTVNLKNHK